jgi:hypothetical protein
VRPLQWRFCLVFGVLAFCLFTAGCGPSQQQVEEESMLKPLAILHGKYAAQHQGKAPADEAEFKKFIDAQSPDAMKAHGITDPARLWVSPRDKEPFGVVYGTVSGPPGPAGQPVVAYESKGVNGKRMVASQLGAVDEVDETRFRELVPAAAPAP